MASFVSSFKGKDWSPTWLLSSLLKPQIFFQSSQKSSSCPSVTPLSTIAAAPSTTEQAWSSSSHIPAAEASSSSSPHMQDASGNISGGGRVSQQEMVALGRIFDHFDENKDGKISRDELRRSLQMFGIETHDAELVAMIDAADWNSDGFLDFSEFASFYYSLNEEMGQKIDSSNTSNVNMAGQANNNKMNDKEANEEAELRDAFKLFDKDGDGYICAEELQSVLGSMGLSQGKLLADCRNMIRSVDVDGDDQVSFEEFKQMMVAGFGQC